MVVGNNCIFTSKQNMLCLANAGLMLGQRRRQRPNIKQWVNVYCIIHTKQYRFFEKKLQYYYHATPEEPCKGSHGVAW